MTDLKSTVADLLAKAEAATPGPWESDHDAVIADTREQVCCGKGYHSCCGQPEVIGECVAIAERAKDNDATYIAAASPTSIIEVCKALEDARGEVDRLTDENEELRNAPWPEWAKKVVATIRAHSGYDGSDDAIDGIDMPQELGEILDEYDGQIKHKDAELATLRAEVERLRSLGWQMDQRGISGRITPPEAMP